MEDSNDTPLNEEFFTDSPIGMALDLIRAEEEITSSRKGKKGSKVWDHYTKLPNGRVKCNYCPKDYAYNSDHGTTTLWKHLRSQCIKCPLFKSGMPLDIKQQTLSFQVVDDLKIGGKKRELVSDVFDNEKCRKSLIKMVVIEDLPFSFVESEAFREFCNKKFPQFTLPSRWTVAEDCLSLYNDEMARLKKIFSCEVKRVCLTMDVWTSIQNLSYMCLTAHYIDHDWRYHKRIINFCVLADGKGDTIGKTIETCLLKWRIDHVFSLTLDNAIANDVAVNYIRKRLKDWNVELANGNHLQVRCTAHILNLVVNEGLEISHNFVLHIRNAIRYVKSSPSRMADFKECARKMKLATPVNVILDVSTKWNSTYKMLESACRYQKAFERMDEDDELYKVFFIENDMEGPPTQSDWENAKVFVDVLSKFYDVMLRLSGSTHITSNEFFHYLGVVNDVIEKLCTRDDYFLRSMGEKMKVEFKKNWGDPKKINHYLYLATILDPRMKMSFLSWTFEELYGSEIANEMISNVKAFLHGLFEEYLALHGEIQIENQEGMHVSRPSSSSLENFENLSSLRWNMFNKAMALNSKTEVERYLYEERITEDLDSFNVLAWWKDNSIRFKILSQVARDVLSIPVSTVSNGSAFSIGGRVLDQFKGSLPPNMVEALTCTQDWLRSAHKSVDLDDDEFFKEASQWNEMDKDFKNPVSSIVPTTTLLSDCLW